MSVGLLGYDRPFATYLTGTTVSLVGDQVSFLALPLTAALVLHAGPAQMGYLAAAGLAPSLLFSLHAGALVDRVGRRRRVMIAADLGRAALVATIPAAAVLGVLTLGQLYAVAFLVGTLSVFFMVSSATLVVSLVPRERYVGASAMLNGSRGASFVIGPTLGGLLVQAVTAPGALAADAVSFLVSAAALLRIRPEEPPVEPSSRGLVTAGARFILRTPIIRAALAATATINLFNFAFHALFILYVSRSLQVPPGRLGMVLSLGSLGALAGAGAATRLSRRMGIGPLLVLGCVLFPAPTVLVPLAGGPAALVLLMLAAAGFGAGLGVMLLDIAAASIFAALIPDQLRARVTGAYMLVNYGVRPLGSVLGGALGATIGMRPTLFIATIGALAGVLWLVPSPVPRLSGLPETAPGRPPPAAAGGGK